MTPSQDQRETLCNAVREARAQGLKLRIRGGSSKDFLVDASLDALQPLDVTGHCGVVDYEPSELVITARCGTPLAEIQTILDAGGQMLPFEPPAFGPDATLGGMISAGLSGPRRPYASAVRDAVLGVQLLTGRGECLQFGGQVMKNVAGYDVSRLVTGAFGTLGVLLEVSVRVMPAPVRSITLKQTVSARQALALFSGWARQPLPVSAACHIKNTLYVRLSGGPAAVDDAAQIVGGREHAEGEALWSEIREHRHGFFASDTPLWRLSVPPATPPLELPGSWLLDWGGAQRWLVSDAPAIKIRATVESVGGHATLFRHAQTGIPRFHPLPAPLARLQAQVRQALDPDGLFNPGHPITLGTP
ncbi:MAG TPA: glycolate oxidase subunit GlcE [Thioalkalivibrio sp.]|nr:glycolate oxidase subunit GlcE [Thioalkalivibrio sp.]